MRLPEFIRSNLPTIIDEWTAFASSLTPVASSMSQLQLKDHIRQILMFIAHDIESVQSAQEQITKSHGQSVTSDENPDTASEIHGGIRHADGFDMVQMVSEYRALRASIIKLWTKQKDVLTDKDLIDLTRFHEAIDQSLAESVARFMEKVVYSKDLLLGILSHDIRSPLGAITMSAELFNRIGGMNDKQSQLTSQIKASATRILNIVEDLLDLTRASLGSGLPVRPQKMSVKELGLEIVREMQIQHPDRPLLMTDKGDLQGVLDKVRLGQVISNLIGNAIQYGAKDKPISIVLDGTSQNILISVYNDGSPIPASQLATIFNSFTRGADTTKTPTDISSNLGLGLFISKEIITSHGGNIVVRSTKAEGTTFTISLPRNN
jgi:signal transduction histidine kinase